MTTTAYATGPEHRQVSTDFFNALRDWNPQLDAAPGQADLSAVGVTESLPTFADTESRFSRIAGSRIARIGATALALGIAGSALLGGGSESAVAQTPQATVTTVHNPNQATRNNEAAVREANILATLSSRTNVGNNPETIDNDKIALPGPIEANTFSMNRGADAWKNYSRDNSGSKQMGMDLLSGKGPFSQSDGEAAREGHTLLKVSPTLTDKLARGDYSDMSIKTVIADSPEYKNITSNHNGKAVVEVLRTNVGEKDAFYVIAYTDKATGAVETILTRADCGGIGGQVFESVTVKKTPATIPVTPTTVKPAELIPTTTIAPTSTTSTTRPATTTTIAPTSTTSTTRPAPTTTIAPTSTTSTTRPAPTTTIAPTTTTSTTTPNSGKDVNQSPHTTDPNAVDQRVRPNVPVEPTRTPTVTTIAVPNRGDSGPGAVTTVPSPTTTSPPATAPPASQPNRGTVAPR